MWVSVCQHSTRCPRSHRPIALDPAHDYDLCPTTTSKPTPVPSAETADPEHSVRTPYRPLSCVWQRFKRNGENGTRPMPILSKGRFHVIWTRIAECRIKSRRDRWRWASNCLTATTLRVRERWRALKFPLAEFALPLVLLSPSKRASER
jgi:hypothetical protein